MKHENFLRENNARHFWHPMAHPSEMLENPPMIISKAENVYPWSLVLMVSPIYSYVRPPV